MQKPAAIRNTTWAELQVGASASIDRSCSVQDLFLFAHVSGNTNPLTLPGEESEPASRDPVAPSMWVGSLISAVLGNILPGPGTLYRAQTLRFHHRVHIGDKLRVTVTCRQKGNEPFAVFDTRVEDSVGNLVCDGVAEIEAPRTTTVTEARDLPQLIVDQKDHFARLIALAAQLSPLVTVVVCPEDQNSLGGAILSARKGLIQPIFVGDAARIRTAAEELGANISEWTVIPESDRRAAAARAVAMVLSGEAGAIIKGAIHSDELLAAVVKKEGGLRTVGRISHVFAMDVPSLDEILFISDAAINIAPDLLTKVEIVQNAIDLARACGLDQPKVGVLSAVETINPNIPSTLDAAILSKMAERGQIEAAWSTDPWRWTTPSMSRPPAPRASPRSSQDAPTCSSRQISRPATC